MATQCMPDLANRLYVEFDDMTQDVYCASRIMNKACVNLNNYMISVSEHKRRNQINEGKLDILRGQLILAHNTLVNTLKILEICIEDME